MAFNEDTSFIEYNVEQPTQDFVTNFDTIGGTTDVVLVTVDGVLTDTPESSYTVQQINHTTWRVTPEVQTGSVVRLYRVTDLDQMMHVFTAGAKFIARNMDNNFKQIRHSQQELRDSTDAFYRDTTKALDDVISVTDDYDAYATATRVIAEAAVTTANSATATANSATATANAATATANTANSTANASNTTAQAANATANAAEVTANEAKATAGTASTTANEAKTIAEGAVVTSNTASNTADEAKQLANTANLTAEDAKVSALEAASQASVSAGLAQEATDISLGLQDQIDAAVITANEANDVASGIAGTANAADTKATEALSTANEAKSTADGIAGTAGTALERANEALSYASVTPMTQDDAVGGISNTEHSISPVVLKGAIQAHAPVQTTVTGNAGTATKLQTSRTIAISGAVTGTATDFDGSANIVIATTAINGSKISTGTIPAARIPILNQSTTGNAASATKLQTARTINGVSFNGTANITVADSTKLRLAGGTMTGALKVNNTTASTSATTGAITTTGGVGIGGALFTTGAITSANNVTAYSDIRIKDNITVIDDALNKVNQMKGVTFNRIDTDDKDKRYVGLIAQDVQSVMPEAVRECENGTLSVDYMGLVGLLIQSIKELDKRIKDLEGV